MNFKALKRMLAMFLALLMVMSVTDTALLTAYADELDEQEEVVTTVEEEIKEEANEEVKEENAEEQITEDEESAVPEEDPEEDAEKPVCDLIVPTKDNKITRDAFLALLKGKWGNKTFAYSTDPNTSNPTTLPVLGSLSLTLTDGTIYYVYEGTRSGLTTKYSPNGGCFLAVEQKEASKIAVKALEAPVVLPLADYAAMRQAVFNAFVDTENTIPAELSVDRVSIQHKDKLNTYHDFEGETLLGQNLTALDKVYGNGDTVTVKIAFPVTAEDKAVYTSSEVTVSFVLQTEFRAESKIALVAPEEEIVVSYDENGSTDYAALEQAILDAVFDADNSTVSAEDVTVTYKYLGQSKPLSGETLVPAIDKVPLTKTHTIIVSFAGNDEFAPASAEVEVTLKTDDREVPTITVKNGETITVTLNNDGSANYDALRQDILDAVVESSDAELTVENTTIKYKSGLIYVPLEGQTLIPAVDTLDSANIQIEFKGNDSFKSAKATADILLVKPERLESSITLNETIANVLIPMGQDGKTDFDALSAALFNAMVKETNPEITAEDVNISYKVLGAYVPLNKSLVFVAATYPVRLEYNGSDLYAPCTAEAEVTFVDASTAVKIVYKEGATITYNMDPEVMRQALAENVIDWELTEVPEGIDLDELKATVSFDYNVSPIDQIPLFAPIEGSDLPVGNLDNVGQMGAGTHTVRARFNGVAGWVLSNTDKGVSVTVQKAICTVKVKSAVAYADQGVPAGMVTVSPADPKLPVVTVYTGATSDISLAIYIDLPNTLLNNSKVIAALDPIVSKITGVSISGMMQNGITVGELRNMAHMDELLETLSKLGLDGNVMVQVLNVVNRLPGIADNVRIAFSTPNRAGLYNVTAIAGSANYVTAVGTGTLLLRMRISGVKLVWNEKIPSSIKASEVGSHDFGVTVNYNGKPAHLQDNVKFLYTGITKNRRLYSSSKVPTEPGSYIVTASTLGGSYNGLPITRTFKIVAG